MLLSTSSWLGRALLATALWASHATAACSGDVTVDPGAGDAGGTATGTDDVIACPEDIVAVTLGPDGSDPSVTVIEVTDTGEAFACPSPVGGYEPCLDAATKGGAGYIELCKTHGDLQVLLDEGAHCGFDDCVAIAE